MDLSGQDFGIHDYLKVFSPPVLSNHVKGFPVYEESDFKIISAIPCQPTPSENLKRLAPRRFEAAQMIDHLLKKIFKDDLPGKEHLASYLRNQYRRNCRPSTLKNIHGTVGYFLNRNSWFFRQLGTKLGYLMVSPPVISIRYMAESKCSDKIVTLMFDGCLSF